jgi:hypothetical protein
MEPEIEEIEKRVYLDYNATTPLAPEVLESITVALRDFWGNPSSSHDAGEQVLQCRVCLILIITGVKAKRCITDARMWVSRMINADVSG